jgi:PAS domain S-box-containing protein
MSATAHPSLLSSRSTRAVTQLLETVAAHSADWLALFDKDCRCLFLNRALAGIKPEAAQGTPLAEFVPLEDRARVHAAFTHLLQTGEARDFEQVVTREDARRPRYLEWRLRAVLTDERISGTVVNITEVTAQRAQRDMLRTQSSIFETMREGVALIDSASGMIRLANPALDRMFGFRPGGLLGVSAMPFCRMPQVQRQRVEENLRVNDGAGPGAIQPIEFECARCDGTRFVASCVITPLRMGGTDHWLAVMTDVTERKHLEREIIEIANREQHCQSRAAAHRQRPPRRAWPGAHGHCAHAARARRATAKGGLADPQGYR